MSKVLDIHTHNYNSELPYTQVEVLTKFKSDPRDHLYCYGLHPWYIKKQKFEQLREEIFKHFQNENYFALGELGLDKACSVDFQLQNRYFLEQIKIANELKINTLVIHCVRSYQEIYQGLKDLNYQGQILIHDYQGNSETFFQFQKEFKIYISLNLRGLTKPNAHSKLKNIPLENIFFETDSEGDLNVKEVYKAYTDLFGLDKDKIEKQVWENFLRLKRD